MSIDTVDAVGAVGPLLVAPAGFPAPGEPTFGRRMLERIIDGSMPDPPCVRRLDLPRPTSGGYGRVEAALDLSEELSWRPGVVFGGYLAGLIDQFAALAMLTVLPDGMSFLTAGVGVEFDAPVNSGAAVVTASVRSIDPRQAKVEVTVGQNGRIACRGRVHQALAR